MRIHYLVRGQCSGADSVSADCGSVIETGVIRSNALPKDRGEELKSSRRGGQVIFPPTVHHKQARVRYTILCQLQSPKKLS